MDCARFDPLDVIRAHGLTVGPYRANGQPPFVVKQPVVERGWQVRKYGAPVRLTYYGRTIEEALRAWLHARAMDQDWNYCPSCGQALKAEDDDGGADHDQTNRGGAAGAETGAR